MKKIFCFLTLLIFSLTTLLLGCDNSNQINVYCPDGAPALSLTLAMDSGLNNTNFKIVDAKKIGGYITGKNQKADVAILPINLASQLVNDGKTYKMLGTITHGNFYFLSSSETASTFSPNDLVGKVVGVVQLINVPGLTLKCVLNKQSIPYKEITSLTQKDVGKVNLMAISNTEIGLEGIDVFLLPSPLADIKQSTTSLKIIGSLGELYSQNGFPQAIVIAKKSLIERDFNYVKNLVKNLKEVNEYLSNESKNKICLTISKNLESGLNPSFNGNNLTDDSIRHSSIKFVSAKNCKVEVNEFILNLQQINNNFVKTFSDDFFCMEDL